MKRNRPVKPPEDRASTWLQVRVRPDEKALWAECAVAEKISLSQWVIGCLNAAAEEI